MLVGANDNPTEVSIHHLRPEPAQPAHQLLKQLGHQPVDHSVQQGVRKQPVPVPAQVPIDVVQDGVRDPSSAVRACASTSASGSGGGGGRHFLDALGDHGFEDTVVMCGEYGVRKGEYKDSIEV